MTSKKCIILANGRPPQKNIYKYLRKHGYNTFICADGGANSARKLNIIPDVIIGDFDSVTKETLGYFSGKSKEIKISRQNDTDVEKCLKYAINNGFKEVILTGVTGDRLDHTFCNLGIVIKFFNKIHTGVIAERSLLVPYKGEVSFTTIPGETVSLYGFNNQTKIKSSGLKYPLRNIALPFGTKESTSNVATGKTVKLKITGGIIFVIRDFSIVSKAGVFHLHNSL
jgi:thiamine pyrophosphokinase